jgi:hypothetical protein
MAGPDSFKVDKPAVLAAGSTLDGCAAAWRQVWDTQQATIEGILAQNPFGDGDIRASIDSWYPLAMRSLRDSGTKMPPFFETMAANCRIFTGESTEADQRLAQQARRQA